MHFAVRAKNFGKDTKFVEKIATLYEIIFVKNEKIFLE
jgi:hypothetical protein